MLFEADIVNQEEDSGEASSKRNGILEEMIGEEEKEEDTQGEEADNNKANNDDSKSVWYRFGSLTITIDLSNRIMADLFVDHYYTVTSINTACQ